NTGARGANAFHSGGGKGRFAFVEISEETVPHDAERRFAIPFAKGMLGESPTPDRRKGAKRGKMRAKRRPPFPRIGSGKNGVQKRMHVAHAARQFRAAEFRLAGMFHPYHYFRKGGKIRGILSHAAINAERGTYRAETRFPPFQAKG